MRKILITICFAVALLLPSAAEAKHAKPIRLCKHPICVPSSPGHPPICYCPEPV